VTLPGLRPVLLFVVTITILASANMFGQSYLISEGAPGNETRTALMYIASEGLQGFKMGNAAAMSYFLALALAIVSIVNFLVFRRRED
jgi:multiple sugar transport system permease protein